LLILPAVETFLTVTNTFVSFQILLLFHDAMSPAMSRVRISSLSHAGVWLRLISRSQYAVANIALALNNPAPARFLA
jgi:hypothetical protein